MPKTTLGAALVILLIFACLVAGGYLIKAEFDKLDARLTAIDESAKTAIAAKEAANKALLSENAALREKEAAAEVEKATLRASLAASERDNEKLRADLKTAPPETVLARTKEWLGTQEIWLRTNSALQTEAVFSIAAFRLNADALADYRYYKFELAPKLESLLKTTDAQLADTRTERDNLVVIVANKDIVIGEKDKQITGRDDTIKALKKSNLMRDWLWRIVAFIAGYAMHR